MGNPPDAPEEVLAEAAEPESMPDQTIWKDIADAMPDMRRRVERMNTARGTLNLLDSFAEQARLLMPPSAAVAPEGATVEPAAAGHNGAAVDAEYWLQLLDIADGAVEACEAAGDPGYMGQLAEEIRKDIRTRHREWVELGRAMTAARVKPIPVLPSVRRASQDRKPVLAETLEAERKLTGYERGRRQTVMKRMETYGVYASTFSGVVDDAFGQFRHFCAVHVGRWSRGMGHERRVDMEREAHRILRHLLWTLPPEHIRLDEYLNRGLDEGLESYAARLRQQPSMNGSACAPQPDLSPAEAHRRDVAMRIYGKTCRQFYESFDEACQRAVIHFDNFVPRRAQELDRRLAGRVEYPMLLALLRGRLLRLLQDFHPDEDGYLIKYLDAGLNAAMDDIFRMYEKA